MNSDPRLYNFFLQQKEDVESFDSLDDIEISPSFNKNSKSILIGGSIKQHDNTIFMESCRKHISKKKKHKENINSISLFGFNFTKL